MTPTTDQAIAALIEQGYTMGDDGTLHPPVDRYADMKEAVGAWVDDVNENGQCATGILAALPHVPIARLKKYLTDEQKRGVMPGRDLTLGDYQSALTSGYRCEDDVRRLNVIARGR